MDSELSLSLTRRRVAKIASLAGAVLVLVGLAMAIGQMYATNFLRGDCVTGRMTGTQFGDGQSNFIKREITYFPIGHTCKWSLGGKTTWEEVDGSLPTTALAYGQILLGGILVGAGVFMQSKVGCGSISSHNPPSTMNQ